MNGRRVVVTRPEVGTLGLRLDAAGAIVDHVPLISIVAPSDQAALSEALEALVTFDWLVVTSANGASAVGAAAAAVPHVRLAAVGVKTAAVLTALAGRPVDLVPGDQRGAGLVDAFPEGPTRVLLAQADLSGGEVESGLRERGAEVVAVEAYRTVARVPSPAEVDLLLGADAIVLASGSAATSLAAAVRLPDAAVVVAIGPSTATVAQRLGYHPVVASSPSDDDLLATIAAAVDHDAM